MNYLKNEGKHQHEIHEMCRVFRHLHNEPIRMIIKAYVKHFEHQEKTTFDDAKQTLKKALNMEHQRFEKLAKREDIPTLKFLATDEAAQNHLHEALLGLKDNVWVLEWCGDWKSIHMFWDYKYGPGYLLVTRTRNKMRPVYFTLKKSMPVYFNGKFDAGDNATVQRLEHEDLANIIRHAWLGTLDKVFDYDVPALKKECLVKATDSKEFHDNLEKLHQQWQRDDNDYCRGWKDDTYRWACQIAQQELGHQMRDKSVNSNPYFCHVLIEWDPKKREDWEQRMQDKRDREYKEGMSKGERQAQRNREREMQAEESEGRDGQSNERARRQSDRTTQEWAKQKKRNGGFLWGDDD